MNNSHCKINDKHISFHIEKTAGTTVRSFLVQMYGLSKVFIYNVQQGEFIRADKLKFTDAPLNPLLDKVVGRFRNVFKAVPFEHFFDRKKIYQNNDCLKIQNLPDDWLAIHGHFNSYDLDSLSGTQQFRTVVMRDPLDRTISHYFDWKVSRGIANQRISMDYKNDIDFRQFALSSTMQNFQSKVIGKFNLKEFDVVGITEELDKFLYKVAKKRRENPELFSINRLNQTPGKPDISTLRIDKAFVKKFRSLYEEDYRNYSIATKISKDMKAD